MAGTFVVNFIRFVLLGLELMILARIFLSFVSPQARGPIATFIIQTTEPILAPVRRLLPRTGMFDFSPLIVILIIGVVLRALG